MTKPTPHRGRKAGVERVVADFIVHGLSSAVLFPKPYRGFGTPVGWDIEELPNASIASRDGMIIWIGPSTRLSEEVKLDPDCRFLDGHGLVAIPGFVDSHTHLVYSGDRSDEFEMRVGGRPYLEILAAGGGILRTVNAVAAASEDEIFQESAMRLRSLIRSGVTTVEIKSGYGLSLPLERKLLKVISRLGESFPIRVVSTFMGAHAVPARFKTDPDRFVDELCEEWIPAIASEGLAEFNDVFTEKKAFSVEQSRRVLKAGLEHGLKPKIHADEINVIGGIDLAVEVGAISADHLLMTGPTGIRKLAGSPVIPTLLPGTSTYLMEAHHASARKMIEAGLPVAVASDHNPGSCQFLGANLIQTLSMLQLRMTASEALIAGTLHAAHALDLGAHAGALEVNRSMDVTLIDAPSFRHIGYRAGECFVRAVICRGIPAFVKE